MSTEVQDLLIEEHSIVGVRATGVHGGVEIRATLTVAADGRDSRLRRKAELVPIETGVPIGVLWLYLPKPQDPPPTILGYVSPHGMVVLTLDRGDSYQAGAVIPKGRLAQLQAEGLDAFRARLVAAVPRRGHTDGLGPDQASVRPAQPPAAVAPARLHRDRRCRPRDVTRLRRGRQLRDPGRRRPRQCGRRTSGRRRGPGRRAL